MQADSIISNTISQDIKLKGHQSIRFTPVGFSVLVSDASYKPVYLKHYTFDSGTQGKLLPAECGRILKETGLQPFAGETVIIVDTLAVTVIPDPFFQESHCRDLLEKACSLKDSERASHRFLKARNFHLVYAIPEEIEKLASLFTGIVKIIHPGECLLSLADQVTSSDHQRGVIVADIQSSSLDILAIQEDHVQLLNRYALKNPSDFIFHTLNTMSRLGLDRESVPIYLSGIIHEEHELYGLLGKYIRYVKTTPYYLEDLSRMQVLRCMVLSEGSKCV